MLPLNHNSHCLLELSMAKKTLTLNFTIVFKHCALIVSTEILLLSFHKYLNFARDFSFLN